MNAGHEDRLAALGITLPSAVSPAANYVPARRTGPYVYISGQVPAADGKDQFTGKLGRDLGRGRAEGGSPVRHQHSCAIARRTRRRPRPCRRLHPPWWLVNAVPEFGEQPMVLNGASDLMIAVFGDAGRHSRAAVGCASLPRNVPVEVDAIFEVL